MRTIKAVIFLMPFVICSNKIFCQSALDTSESKVDYLEQIYFSGENKEGLLNEIDMMIQKFDGKEVTPAIAKQYGFLSGIKSQAANAAKSCDVLDLISAGIFELDAAEATRQGVHRPSKKASADVSGALKNISGIGNTLSSSSWNTYLLSGGKINTLGVTGKVAGVTNTIGTVASTYDEVKKFAGALGLGKKDKNCDDIPKKEIVIGEHNLPPKTQQSTTDAAAQVNNTNTNSASQAVPKSTIFFKNLDYSQLSTLTSAIEKIPGVTNVLVDDFSNNNASVSVQHNMKLNELANKIIASGTNLKLSITGMNKDSATIGVAK